MTKAAAIEPEDYGQIVHLKLVLLALLGGAVFLNSVQGVYIPIGTASILEDPDVQHLGMSPRAWLSSQRLATWSLAVNYAISGKDLWSYHLVNIALHVLAGLTLFGLVCRTLLRGDTPPRLQEASGWLAMAAALLWMIHPVQTQSVDDIHQRGVLLGGLFCLLTLYCLVRGADRNLSGLWYGLAILSCAVGMGESPATVATPLLALAYDRIYLADSWADLRRRAWVYAGLAGCWLLLLPLFGPASDTQAAKFYLQSQPAMILQYLGLIFWPSGLCFDYTYWRAAEALSEVVRTGLAVAALLAGTIWALYRWPKIGFPALWFWLTLLPLSLWPQDTLLAESRLYLPLAGLVTLVVVGGYALALALESRAPWAGMGALGLAGLVAVVLGFLSFQRNRDYDNPYTLWQQADAINNINVRAHFHLANALLLTGKAENYKEAAGRYRVVLGEDKLELHQPARHNLAIVYLLDGQLDRAMKVFADIPPGDADAAVFLDAHGFTLWSKKDYDGAERCFREAARLQPKTAMYRFNRAQALSDAGRKEEAGAVKHEALQMDPQWPKKTRELAWQLATAADPRQRNGLQALFLAQQACQFSPELTPELLDTLAAAYARVERFKDAVTTAEKALQLATDRKQEDQLRPILERLTLYKAQRPFQQARTGN